MLEGIPAIAWSELSHAYGSAEKIPDLLLRLASPRAKEWVNAIGQLSDSIYHQETFYDSTAPTIPFLIELLHYPEVKCRGRILRFLASLVEPDDYDADGAKDDVDQETSAYREFHAACQRDVQRAVWGGWETYVDLGADVDKRIRVIVPKLLGDLSKIEWPDQDQDVAAHPFRQIPAALCAWCVDEPNEIVRASQLMAIGKWGFLEPSCLAVLKSELVSDTTGLTPPRLATAMALAEHPQPPDEALAVLALALENAKLCKTIFSEPGPSVEERHDPLTRAMKIVTEGPESVDVSDSLDDDEEISEDFRYPWIVWEVMPHVMMQLNSLDCADLEPLSDRLVRLWTEPNNVRIWQGRQLVRKLLFADMDWQAATPSTLTQPQRDVLTFLFESAKCWATRVRNIEDDFASLNVPYDRELIGGLLQRNWVIVSEAEALKYLHSLLREELVWVRGAPKPNEPINESHYENLTEASLEKIGCDHFMPLLSRFPNLQTVTIGTHTTDRGLSLIGELPKLQRIGLNARITDTGFAELRRFPSLQQIWIHRRDYTDAVAETFAKLPKLKELRIAGTLLTDAGLIRILETEPPITDLVVSGTRVTDAAFAVLAKLRKLRICYVEDIELTDVGLKRIAESGTPIECLYLNGTKITGAMLPALAQLELLRVLQVKRTAVTAADVQRLTALRPDVTVRR